MLASAFPLADMLIRSDDAARRADDGASGRAPSSDELPFPPGATAGAGESGDAAANPNDASSVPGSLANGRAGLSSSGTGSALLDQVLGAAKLAGYHMELPQLPVDKLSPVNPLRAAILEWITVTNSQVPADELARELARADALPQGLQRDLALLVLSAAEATKLQHLATAALSDEQLAWIQAHPEVASDLARGIVNKDTQHLAFLAALVDTPKSLQAALLMLQAAEATRGSLADAASAASVAQLADTTLDAHAAELLRLLASAGSRVSDADKVRFAAEIIALTSGLDMPEAPAEDVTFAAAVQALLASTGTVPDAASLRDVLARADMLPRDLQRALALPILAQARAVDAANPLLSGPDAQPAALLGVLVAVSEAMPTLEKYHLYWRTAPEALRVSTWDAPARLAWAIEHAAMFASTGGGVADLVRAGGILQGLGLVEDQAVPQRSFVDALAALGDAMGRTMSRAERDNAARAADTLEPAVREAAARLLSGAAEAARLHERAWAGLTAEEREFLLTRTFDIDAILAKENPTHEEIQHLAYGTALSERVDRAALVRAGVVAARATAEAHELLSGAGAFSAQAARVTPVETGLGALLSRLLPFGTARAQPSGCVPIDGLVDPSQVGIQTGGSSSFLITNDCENDVLLRVFLPPFMTDMRFGQVGDRCVVLEGPNPDVLVITGAAGTTHRPPQGTRTMLSRGVTCEQILSGRGNFQIESTQTVPTHGAAMIALDLGGSDTWAMPVAMTYPTQAYPIALHLEMEGSESYANPSSLYDDIATIRRYIPGAAMGHPTQASAFGGGVAILFDASGSDRYDAPAASQGYARFGVGLLADLSGNDGYTAANMTQGSANENWNTGLGMLVDSDGDDSYSAISGQGYGVGGLLLDLGGRDLYFNDVDELKGIPIAHLTILPGGELTALNERGDGRIWVDGPEYLNPGLGVDIERTTSGTDSDGDSDSDFIEFLAGSNPHDDDNRAADGPNNRLQEVAGDTDLDLFPDFVERALSTDPENRTDYPVGIPLGPTVRLPFLGELSPGSILQMEGTPRGQDKIIDLRLPLQDAGTIDRACTGLVHPQYNLTLPMRAFGVISLHRNDSDPTFFNSTGPQQSRCSSFSFKSAGDGTGNGTMPGIIDYEPDSRNYESTENDEFYWEFPQGILAIGDSVPTRYATDYFVVIDIGGNDRFNNRAGGAVPVQTRHKAEDETRRNTDNLFLSPTLVVNVDLTGIGAQDAGLRNPAGDLGADRYDKPVNATRNAFTQGSLFGVLIDTAGNDAYTADDASQGSLGGVLLDLGGADVYRAGNLSQGAALFLPDAAASRGFADQPGFPAESDRKPTVRRQSTEASLTSSSLLLDLGDGMDQYYALAHSQGYSRSYATGGSNYPSAGILLDQGGPDFYTTARSQFCFFAGCPATKQGFDSQAVATAGGIAVLADLAGSDTYHAWGFISQGASTSATYGWPQPTSDTRPEPGFAALLDLGGADNYTYYDRAGPHWRTEARENNLTVTRADTPGRSNGQPYRYNGQPSVHLDIESSEPTLAINAIAGANITGSESFLLNLPTARLAIGDGESTVYDHEYALVVDLGGDNVYNFNAGGFVPDILYRSQTTANDTLGGGSTRTLSLFPVSFVLDAGIGSSSYTAPNLLAQGAGFFSVGVLVDAGGKDVLRALPGERWSMANDWKNLSLTLDGLVTPREWNDTEARLVQLVGSRDPRFTQEAVVRMANDERNLYVGIELNTSSVQQHHVRQDRLFLELNPGRTLQGWDSEASATGIDQIHLVLNETGCRAEDRHWFPKTVGNSNFFDDRDWGVNGGGPLARDGRLSDGKAANEPNEQAYPFSNVRAACTYKDGTWSIELIKPFNPRIPADQGDMTYTYDGEHGFLQDTTVAFRLAFREGVSRDNFTFPAGSTTVDGDFGYRRDGSLSEEIADWASTSLANLRARSPVPVTTRLAALSQGAGIAGVGLVAMTGTVESGNRYVSAERSQGYAAFGGFGLLLDAGGDDEYVGSDLVQGVGVSSGTGVLVDGDGSDRYVSFTRANGYGNASGMGVFADLHGYDDYVTFGFRPAPLPDCLRATDAVSGNATSCEMQAGVMQAKGNQKTWRNGAYGSGIDLLSNDEVRGQVADVYQNTLYDEHQTFIKFFPVPAEGGCDALDHKTATPFGPAEDLGRIVLSGSACVIANVDLTQASGRLLGGTISVEKVSMLVDWKRLSDFRLVEFDANRLNTTWRAHLDTSGLDDGVAAIAAQAVLRVSPANGRGAILFMDDVHDRAEDGFAYHRVIINNEPDIQLRLEPFVEGVGAVFSPVASMMPPRLYVNWSVSHDGGEDRVEAWHGYRAPAEGRNVPCTYEDARQPETEVDLCHVLPFYFKPNDGEARWDTEPGQSRARMVTERSDPNTDLSQELETLETPLRIWKEEGLLLVIPNRTAILRGGFNTTVKLSLIDAAGNPHLVDGRPVVLAEQRFNSTQEPEVGGIGAGLTPAFDAVRPTLQRALNSAGNLLGDNALANLLATAYRIPCGEGYSSEAAWCDVLHGDYGYGNLRICRSAWWNGIMPPHGGNAGNTVSGTGACTTYTPSNATLAAARDFGPLVQERINVIPETVNYAADRLSAPPADGLNWTLFRVQLNDAFGPVSDNGTYIEIPAGFGLKFEMTTVHDPIDAETGLGGERVISIDEFYRNVVLGGQLPEGLGAGLPIGLNPALDAVEGCSVENETVARVDCAHVRVNQTVAGRRVSADVNVTDTIRWRFNNDTNFRGLDGLLENPIPVSFFRYGSPEDLARLEIRTPAEPKTHAKVEIINTQTSQSFVLAEGIFEGDTGDTPSIVVADVLGNGTRLRFGYDDAVRRFSQRETPLEGTTANDLPDGKYQVKVVARDPYTNVPVTSTMNFTLDKTEARSVVTTPRFVGAALLAEYDSAIPITWATFEQGSGVRRVHVYWTFSSDLGVTCNAQGVMTSNWKPMKSSPFDASINLATDDAHTNLQGDQSLKVLTLAEDFAGNLEHSLGGSMCEAIQRAAGMPEGVGYAVIRKDVHEPEVGSTSVSGTRVLSFQGSEFDFVKAGTPVTFSVCAADTLDGSLSAVQLALYSVNATTGHVVNHTYPARLVGDCAGGRSLWVSDQWGDFNWNKTLHPDGVWSAVFEVYDRAGNRQTVPVANLILDAVAPSVEPQPPAYPSGQSAVKGGDLLSLRVLASDAFGVDTNGIVVDASALNRTGNLTTRAVRIGGVAYQEATLRVDQPGIENGLYEIPIRVPDNAGNVREGVFVVRVDFQRFEVVPGSLRVEELTHNSAVVKWQTTQPTTGLVRYGTSPVELRQRTQVTQNATTEHAVLVTGLTPSTTYHFRATSFSAGGFSEDSGIVTGATQTALFLRGLAPAAGAAVSGLVDVRFEGGLLDSTDFVTYTLYVHQPHKDEPWSFVTTATRQGLDHTIRWNSSRHLDGDGYKLRIVAKAGEDVAEAEFGPFTSDNGKPVVTVVSPQPAVNDSRPVVSVQIRDGLSGFGTEDPVLLIDGREVKDDVRIERTNTTLRLRHEIASPLSSGPHDFEIRVSDRAGNFVRHAWEVFVDSEAPGIRTTKIEYVPGTTAARAGGQVLLNLSVQDASGVAEVLADARALDPDQLNVSLHRAGGSDHWIGVLDVSAGEDEATKTVYVTAFDRAGNRRVAGIDIPVDNRAPSAGGSRVTNVTHTRAVVQVLNASEPVVVRATAVSSNTPQAAAATAQAAVSPELVFEGLLPSRSYEYTLRLLDGAGNEALLTGRFTTLRDTTPPSQVQGVGVIDLLNGTLRLSWEPARDDIGVAFYRIYRSDDGASFDVLAEVRGLTHDDGQLPFEKSFTYQVVAVDHGGNEGQPSDRLTAAATAVPRLGAGTASPSVGTTSTVFRYTVTYVSPSGKAPASVLVIIDGVPHEMRPETDSVAYATGVTYVYETRLAPHTRDAPHTYSFEATDGRYTVKFPDDGSVMRGPLVSGDSFASGGGGFASFAQRVPLGGLAGVSLAVVAAALLAALVVRKKKGGSK